MVKNRNDNRDSYGNGNSDGNATLSPTKRNAVLF